jgi:hypothetical protein
MDDTEQRLWSSDHLLPKMSITMAQSLLMYDFQKSKSRNKKLKNSYFRKF